jgi:shikimate-5-dehydrogenase/3-dehydroquinate dehydratase type I
MDKTLIAFAILSLLASTSSSFILSSNKQLKTNSAKWGVSAIDVCPGGIAPTLKQHSSTKLNQATIDKSSASTRQNKFQGDSYDKPIVLIGCSGKGNELGRLASSVSTMMGGESGIENESIINGANLDETDLVEKLKGKKLNKSNLIVIDFNESENSEKLTSVAKTCYEEDLLAIYVNVHPVGSEMSSSTQEVKSNLEDSVFTQYSDYELCIKDEGLDTDDIASLWEGIEWETRRMLARAFLPLAIPGSDEPSVNSAKISMGANTFFLSLSFPDIMEAEPYMEAMNQDVDAMEFRTDLLACRDDRFDLLYSLQKLRAMCRPHAVRAPMLPFLGEVIDDSVPVVYTVRTAHQAGTYPDDKEGIDRMFNILELGLRSGVEILDVESAWDEEKTDSLLKQVEDRYPTQVLGSHHVVGETVSDEEATEFYRKCALGGRAHGAKVVLSIDDQSKDHQALHAAESAIEIARKEGDPIIPHIGLILGDVGQYSRVINIPYTPVTHESLPFVAAPGQMTASELMATRLIMDIVPPTKYGILGHNIAYSVSPAMQGAAFASTSLPHSYSLIDMEDVDEFVESDLFNDEAFGGCSVTIPHKQAIIPHLDILTDAAKAIGAVNTVIVQKSDGESKSSRVLLGDNTDWRGIFNPLRRKLGSFASSNKVGTALILGGGGTARAAAYAATQLGLEKIYYNRTPSKAQDLADSFGGTVASSLDDLSSEDSGTLGSILDAMNGEIRVIISTLPAAAEFELPVWLINIHSASSEQSTKPIIFDVNYKPYWTKLLHQANNSGFPLVRGSEMLWEQGVGQFELWTGRTAPYKVMKSVVLENCLPELL